MKGVIKTAESSVAADMTQILAEKATADDCVHLVEAECRLHYSMANMHRLRD